MVSHFLLMVSKNFFLSLASNIFTMMCLWISVWLLLGVCRDSCMCRIMFFIVVGQFSAISLNIFFCSLYSCLSWQSRYSYVVAFHSIPHFSEAINFSLFFLSIYLQVCCFYCCQFILNVSSSSEFFFIFIIVLFSTRISILMF